jgi:hypothetical protein
MKNNIINKMVRFNSDQMQAAMRKRHNIRNISIIAHIDSGKIKTNLQPTQN